MSSQIQLFGSPRPRRWSATASQMSDREVREFQKEQCRRPIQEQFEQWLSDNPAFWPAFVYFASEIKSTGREFYSVKAIIERVRWHMAIKTKGEPFKINNNYTSRLARKLETEHREFAGFFKTRKLLRK